MPVLLKEKQVPDRRISVALPLIQNRKMKQYNQLLICHKLIIKISDNDNLHHVGSTNIISYT